MLKSELKKLFKSRYIIVTLILTAAVIFGFAAYTHSLYESQKYYAIESVLLDSRKFTPITVTKDNIESLENRLAELEEDTDEYQILNYVTQNWRWTEYCTTLDYFANYKGVFTKSTDGLPPQQKCEYERDVTRIENGITYASSFGWSEMLKSGTAVLPVIIFLIIVLAAAELTSNEHETGMYQLMISSKNGRNKIIRTKTGALVLFSVILSMMYGIALLISFSAFFTLSGSKADSAMVLFGRVLTFNQCFIIMMIMLTVSAAASALAALGISCLCRKNINACGINIMILLLALIFGHFFNFISDNMNGFTQSLPVNIPLIDYGIAEYREYTRDSVILGAYNILAPFIPMCIITAALSLPIILKNWVKTVK